jgi:hypothetical protein
MIGTKARGPDGHTKDCRLRFGGSECSCGSTPALPRTTKESHTDLYPALQTAIAKIEDQKRELERRQVRINGYADANVELRAALARYGKHDSSGMSDQPGCQKTRMGGGPCTCGLDEVMR